MLLAREESRMDRVMRMSHDERAALFAGYTDAQIEAWRRAWVNRARPKQMTPEELFRWWVIMAGRGWGKNQTGSEWVAERAEAFARADHLHLIGLMNATYADVRSVQINGESGLRAVCERRGHRLRLAATALEGALDVWRQEGCWHSSTIEVHTADQPDRARGRNFHTVWADELAKWRQKIDGQGGTAFTNVDFGLRSLCPPGMAPQGLVTMTPKPTALVRDLADGAYGRTVVTTGSMFENRTHLAVPFMDAVLRRYHGTRLGAQEIEGRLLDEIEGALWNLSAIELSRLRRLDGIDLVRIVVGVDPAGGGPDECGIIVAGWGWGEGGLPHMFVLDDASVVGDSSVWAPVVIKVAREWQADAVVVEDNYGGGNVVDVLSVRDPMLVVRRVHAARGKAVRAEPVADLWAVKDQGPDAAPLPGRGHMVGVFPELETELTTWVPGDPISPGRLDALCWCGHALIDGLASVDATVAYGSAVADARL